MSRNIVHAMKCPKISSVLRNVPKSRPCKEMSQNLVRTKKCRTFLCMDDILGHFLVRTISWDISLHGRDLGTFLSTDEILEHFFAWTQRNVPRSRPYKEMSQDIVRTKKCPKISSMQRNVPRSRSY
jgi:hypothetical protein